MTTVDRLHIRWLTFCEVRTFPRDTNEIIQSVIAQLGAPGDLVTGMIVADELDVLEADGLMIVHAQNDERNLLEVRLNHEGL